MSIDELFSRHTALFWRKNTVNINEDHTTLSIQFAIEELEECMNNPIDLSMEDIVEYKIKELKSKL